MYHQSWWIHLCYPEAGAFTEWDGERRDGLFASPLPEGSNTVFPHCLTCQSVGKTKQELVCVGISGKACPSLLMKFTWKWSVTHRASKSTTWAQWGSIHTWLVLLVHAFFCSLSVGGEEDQDSGTQQVGHSHGGEMWALPCLSIIQLPWGNCLGKA